MVEEMETSQFPCQQPLQGSPGRVQMETRFLGGLDQACKLLGALPESGSHGVYKWQRMGYSLLSWCLWKVLHAGGSPEPGLVEDHGWFSERQ